MSSINTGSNPPTRTLEAVYYVETADKKRGEIAIRPSFQGKNVTWDDTSNGRVVHLDAESPHWTQLNKQSQNSLVEKISVVFKDHTSATLQYLTLDLYNEKLKSRVVGSPDFSSTEELQNYYLQTDFFRLE